MVTLIGAIIVLLIVRRTGRRHSIFRSPTDRGRVFCITPKFAPKSACPRWIARAANEVQPDTERQSSDRRRKYPFAKLQLGESSDVAI
jgi:hypothetical protein